MIHWRIVDWLRRHAAGDRNSLTITVTQSRAGRPFQIELPRWSVRVVSTVLIAAFALVIVGGILYGRLMRDALILREVRKENEMLRARAARFNELEDDVAQLEQVRRQILLLAGVPEAEAARSGASVGADSVAITAETAPGAYAGELSEAALDSPLRVLPFQGPVSRGFMPKGGRGPEHPGVDIAGPTGAPVMAAADGEVAYAGQDTTFGNLLILRHQDGWETRYGHNQALVVSSGETVRAGQTVGLLGSTGRSSAPHLHFEVLRDGQSVDPGTFFSAYRVAHETRAEAAR